MLRSLVLLPLCLLTACSTPEPPSTSQPKPNPTPPPHPDQFSPRDVDEFRRVAAHFKSTVAVPKLESTPSQVRQSVSNIMARADAALDAIASCSHDKLTLGNTIVALDNLAYDIGLTANRINLIKETSTNAALREAATEVGKTLSEWAVGIEYREDVYRVIHAYALTLPKLFGEEEKLLKEVLRDYRRSGLTLPPEQRAELERLRKELTRLTADFDANIPKAQAPLKFTRAELDGVPEEFLAQPGLKTGPDEYTVQVNVTFQFLAVMENARHEATRRRVLTAQNNLARDLNVPLLQKILELRDRIARQLGYASWAD